MPTARMGSSTLEGPRLILLELTGAFRQSELVALDVEYCSFSKNGVTMTVRRFKTDQEGVGRKLVRRHIRDGSLFRESSAGELELLLGPGRQPAQSVFALRTGLPELTQWAADARNTKGQHQGKFEKVLALFVSGKLPQQLIHGSLLAPGYPSIAGAPTLKMGDCERGPKCNLCGKSLRRPHRDGSLFRKA